MPAKPGQVMNPNGRKKGKPNKVTAKMRQHLEEMLNLASPHMLKWIARVADGYSYQVMKKGEKVTRKVRPNPGEAFKLTMMLAEYVVPKLSRIEMDEGGITQNTFLIAIQNNLKQIATKPTTTTDNTDGDEGDGEGVLQG